MLKSRIVVVNQFKQAIFHRIQFSDDICVWNVVQKKPHARNTNNETQIFTMTYMQFQLDVNQLLKSGENALKAKFTHTHTHMHNAPNNFHSIGAHWEICETKQNKKKRNFRYTKCTPHYPVDSFTETVCVGVRACVCVARVYIPIETIRFDKQIVLCAWWPSNQLLVRQSGSFGQITTQQIFSLNCSLRAKNSWNKWVAIKSNSF